MARPANVNQRHIRRTEVAQLLRKGRTIREIAEDLGHSTRTVQKDVKAIREDWRLQANLDFDSLVATELASIDAMQSLVWNEACEGSLKAVDSVLTAIDRRCRLLGLYEYLQDKPKPLDEAALDAEIRRIDERLTKWGVGT